MNFTYESYGNLLSLLRERGYKQANYWNYQSVPYAVILRHDIDTSLKQALAMAEYEAKMGVKSTYFLLLKTDFYNPASTSAQCVIQRIHSLGHEIGLHFDEEAYPTSSQEEITAAICNEASILSNICGFSIRAVSMHRPSQQILAADITIPNMVNSYGHTFFRDFKYLSDSRRRWREPVEEIVSSKSFKRLHILTHPFWYHRDELSLEESVKSFILHANSERYLQMEDNVSNLSEVMKAEELLR